MRLDGKVAIVTGGASGMGASTAKIFAREGCKVVVADQLDDEGQKIVAEIVAANGAASFQHLDVTDEANWRSVVAATLAEFGKLDILVNNAGISGSAVDDLFDTAAWDKIMDVNARGARCARRPAGRSSTFLPFPASPASGGFMPLTTLRRARCGP
jgi:NAD(P)-dependent dehydrogenase (short-subunit alcohol dehydrogenase family)